MKLSFPLTIRRNRHGRKSANNNKSVANEQYKHKNYILHYQSSTTATKRTEDELDDENLAYITEAAERAQGIIYAVGTGGDGSKTVLKQQRDVLNLLIPWKDKMQCIADANGKKFYHPLCPAVHHRRFGFFVNPAS